jgi:hypothetical protein
MRYGDGRQKMDVPLRDVDILGLLIRFLLENNVPIPRAGTKAAMVIDGNVALSIDSGHFSEGGVQGNRTAANSGGSNT